MWRYHAVGQYIEDVGILRLNGPERETFREASDDMTRLREHMKSFIHDWNDERYSGGLSTSYYNEVFNAAATIRNHE